MVGNGRHWSRRIKISDNAATGYVRARERLVGESEGAARLEPPQITAPTTTMVVKLRRTAETVRGWLLMRWMGCRAEFGCFLRVQGTISTWLTGYHPSESRPRFASRTAGRRSRGSTTPTATS